jgi:hypothetical protein
MVTKQEHGSFMTINPERKEVYFERPVRTIF